MKSVLLCVATKKGLEVLDAALAYAETTRFHVCTFREINVATSYTDKIRDLATAQGMPLLRWADFRQDPLGYVKQFGIEGILCIGWRYLIPDDVIRWLDGNVIAAHDSILPKLRGFASLPTALIAGEERAGVTFLRGSGMDNGAILWQQAFDILPRDTIADLIQRTLPMYRAGAVKFLNGELRAGVPQDETRATYSVWRDEADYWIDWSLDSETVDRTIRALGDPYLGARCRLGDKTVAIHEGVVVPDVSFAIRQPGKVWTLDDQGRPTVVCGRGMLRVQAATCDGQSIIPMRSLRVRFQ